MAKAPKPLKPNREEAAALRRVLAGAKAAGLRVPKISMTMAEQIILRDRECHACAFVDTGEIVVRRGTAMLDEVIAHEVAHVIVNQMVWGKAADHNRFWALVYGVLYQQVIGA